MEKLAPMRLASQLDERTKTLPVSKRRTLLKDIQTFAQKAAIQKDISLFEHTGLHLDADTKPLLMDFIRVLHHATK